MNPFCSEYCFCHLFRFIKYNNQNKHILFVDVLVVLGVHIAAWTMIIITGIANLEG